MLRCLPIFALLVAGCPASQPKPAPSGVGPPAAGAAGPVTVTLKVTGFRSEQGSARVALFRSPDGFPADYTKAERTWTGKILVGQLQLSLPDMAPGAYAIAVIHDENDNGALDLDEQGRPIEGLGLSNDPAQGRAAFAQARFDLDPDDPVVEIEMRYP